MSHVAAFALLNGENESRDVLFAIECDAIRQVLTACGGNVSEAAKKLGIHRQSLQRKIRRMLASPRKVVATASTTEK